MKTVRTILSYAMIIVAVVLIRTFIITPISVDGSSMMPNLTDSQVLLLKKYKHDYKRFDIIVFKYGDNKLIKRIIGLPGEKIEYIGSKLFVNDNYIEEPMIKATTHNFKLSEIGYDTIPEDYYFVLGDNRINSKDSRIIGLVHKSQILGVTDFSLFPFSSFGFLDNYE